jgi:predicted nicotinamide N-methyase
MSEQPVLPSSIGDLPLDEVQLHIGDRDWTILHSGAVLSRADEDAFLAGEATRLPYGIVLWPSAIALAHELASRPIAGKRILELGAGTGIPGIIAASFGAHVVQTDRQALVLHLCRRNAERNGITTLEHRIADWTTWTDVVRYDVILGSDILYAPELHPHLRHIFETNLAPGGTILLGDPLRRPSVALLQNLEADGWTVTMAKWTVGITPPPRTVAVFELTRPTSPVV